MAEREIMVFCCWNGCIKYGADGVYYEGSTCKKMKVKQKTEFNKLLDGLYLNTGFDKLRLKIKIFGRYPVADSPHRITYVLIPVVNNGSLETMLQVPSKHPSMKSVELYLKVKPTSFDVATDAAACYSKRQRVEKPQEANGYVEKDNEMDNNIVHKELNVPPGFEASARVNLNKGINSSSSRTLSVSSLWVEDNDLRVGLCYRDSDELRKAVNWCCIKGMQRCAVR